MRLERFLLLVLIASSGACHQSKQPDAKAMVHENMEQLTSLIVYDIFSPPVASRIYAYASLGSFEAIRFAQADRYRSIAAQLRDFDPLPQPLKNQEYDFHLAAAKTFFTIVRKMTFSVDSLVPYETKLFAAYQRSLADSVFTRSVEFGDAVALSILKRAGRDNYASSRSKPRFTGSHQPGKWRPTPPDYFDGVEFCWGTMSTFVMDSSSQFAPPPPPAYSEDSASIFFRATKEVYDIRQHLTPEQKDIARYWDDNPLVMQHAGHMMFATKKITPGGHWMGITRIACEQTSADQIRSAQAYALVSIAIFDAFVGCWEEKYKSSVIRPVTVINEKIDPDWMPFLQTPPFPEYPSGHSSITRAAATVLTQLFGDRFAFLDNSDLKYIGMQRSFGSFIQAADEASISRVYGGIHYLHSVKAGADQGRRVGEYIINRIKL